MSEDRNEERIQRIMARAGISSRRKAEELIREGRVTVNGEVAEVGDKADPERDAIKVDGRRLQPHTGPFRYLLLNKPRAVMSTVSDPEGRQTVMDFVPPAMRKALVPVGRLDFETEGLILLTDDGDFALHVAHPRYGGSKTYEVKVKGEPAMDQIAKLRAGIVLDGKLTAPAKISPRVKSTGRKRRLDEGEGHNTWWIVELAEGRTRQIREMFMRIGHPVQKLRRVAIGPIRAPGLPLGALRELTDKEVETLRKITARPKKRPEPEKEKAMRPAREKPAVRLSEDEAVPAAPRKPSRIVPVKKKAAKKAPALQDPDFDAPASKTPARKAPFKKPAAKKAPAKRAGAAKRAAGAKPAARKSAPAKRSGPGGGARRGPGAGRGRKP
jgi:23S rRNA pseudouridine2605 synthase